MMPYKHCGVSCCVLRFRGVCISECIPEPSYQPFVGREPFDGGQGLWGEPGYGLMLVEVEGG